MNRWLNQFKKTFEKEVVEVLGRVTFGAAGAPTLDLTNNSKGIRSITRTGAGKYDIVLGLAGANASQDVYNKFMALNVTFVHATAPAAPLMFVVSESVATPTTGKITIQFTNTAQAATDPGNGEEVKLQIVLRNSNAP